MAPVILEKSLQANSWPKAHGLALGQPLARPYRTIAGWFLRPDCAPSSECTQFAICGQNPRNDVDATFLDPHISVVDCRCTLPVLLLHATIGGRLPEWQTSKRISPVSFVRIESNFFTIHRRHRRKKWWTRILKFEFYDFWNFQKGVDLDHYGHGQTRSE